MRLALAVLLLTFSTVHAQTTHTVSAGGNLQQALDTAACGDTVSVEAGATFGGTIVLAKACGTNYINIRSSRIAELPAGQRVTPVDAAKMPKIVTPGFGNPALQTTLGASGYRLEGIEFSTKNPATNTGPPEAVFAYSLVWLGSIENDQDTLEKMAKNIVIDRSYLHAWPNQSLKRGIDLHSGATDITNSYFEGFKVVGQEAQAILGCRGSGPYKIINNHLEGAGENVMFGACDPKISGLIPSDIEIRRNYFYKPLSWRGVWQVKNLFELKNAQRVVIEGNVFENTWADAQNGHAIVFTPRNAEGSAPWSRVWDVQFINNIVRHATEAFQISANDNIFPTTVNTRNITIRNNLFEDINNTWSNAGLSHSMWSFSGAIENLTIEHNTAISQYGLYLQLPTQVGFVFKDNISAGYPVCDGGPQGGVLGLTGLNLCATGSSVAGNIVGNIVEGIGGGYYPPGNFTVTGYDAIGFVNFSGGNYRLAPTSPFKGKGTNGTDPGANIDAIEAAIAGAVTPLPSPTPVPSPSPAPSPTPTPTPSPSPSPSPIPPTCSITGPDSVTVWNNSTTSLSINISGLTAPGQVIVIGSTGQVAIAPLVRPVVPTGAILAYSVKVKKQGRTITFRSPCGDKSVVVNVQ